MKRINLLTKHIAELIAAGEVVERPSSVVKEIVENSIDAGATKIQIEIENGGTSLIRVSDNGHGIYREDIKSAFLRHATSKIKDEIDLGTISTLGFRGEALSSISAVSKVEVVTFCKGEETGTRYLINGGEEVLIDDAGRAVGTTITVRDLFFNTPARMKFLKKNGAESNSVAGVVDRIALSHPEVSFKFTRDGKDDFNTPGDGKLSSCIYSVYGKVHFDGMIPVENEFKEIKIKGFVSRPSAAKNNRGMQHFFINGRYVKSKTACVALEEAFKGSITKGKYPYCVIYMDIPFESVDVNVHPSKIEVRFVDEKPIFDVIYYGIKSSLTNYDKKKEFKIGDIIIDSPVQSKESAGVYTENKREDIIVTTPSKPSYDFAVMRDSGSFPSVFSNRFKEQKNTYEKKSVYKDIFKENKDDVPVSYKTTGITVKKPDILVNPRVNSENTGEKDKIKDVDYQQTLMSPSDDGSKKTNKVIGEIFSCYIIVQSGSDEMILIDKHAAHERILYEKLKSQENDNHSQLLVDPIMITLDKDGYGAILENNKTLLELGYQIEDFGPGSIMVRGIPVYTDVKDAKSSLEEIADYILKNKRNLDTSFREWLYHNISCRAAIKAGKESSSEEIIDLVNKLQNNKNIMYCPHGRPVYVVLKKNDIEKQFNRT